MKLLLDENLSYRIVSSLQDFYPGSTQVTLVGLERPDDRAIWAYAKTIDSASPRFITKLVKQAFRHQWVDFLCLHYQEKEASPQV